MSGTDSGHPRKAPSDDAAALVLQLCHEVRNCLHGVGLQAQLLDEDLGARELARASIDLEELSDRGAALMALVRPLLRAPAPVDVEGVRLAALLARWADGFGGRGVDLRVETTSAAGSLPRAGLDAQLVQSMVESLVSYALRSEERASSRPERVRIEIARARDEDALVVAVEDDGPPDPPPPAEGDEKLGGRALVCAVAREILEASGGGLAIERSGGRTRISLRLPPAA